MEIDCLRLWLETFRVSLLDHYTSDAYIVNKLNGRDTTYKPKISRPEEIRTMIKPIFSYLKGRYFLRKIFFAEDIFCGRNFCGIYFCYFDPYSQKFLL